MLTTSLCSLSIVARLWLVHSVEGDRHRALHLCPGDLRHVLGVEDQHVPWPLGPGATTMVNRTPVGHWKTTLVVRKQPGLID